MKKILKNPIFMFILGVVLTSGIAVTASQLFAKDVTFTPSNPEWTLSENTVEDAINDLYDMANVSTDETLLMFASDFVSMSNNYNSVLDPTYYCEDCFDYNSSTKVFTAKKI